MITNIEVFPLNLPMKQNFMISGGKVGDETVGAPHVYVKITNEHGDVGWGEARPSHRWSYETLETVTTTIRTYFKPVLMGVDPEDLNQINRLLDQQIKNGLTVGQPIAKAAVDMAIHDLLGHQHKKSLARLWYSKPKTHIDLSYLISTDNPDDAVKKARFAVDNGYKGLDVKIGFDLKKDIEIVEAVKQAAPELFFRVDANQGYSFPIAVKAAKYFEKIGIDVFEQPLKANDLLGHAQLRKKTSIPIALDESIWTPSDLIQTIRLEACDTVVIKLTKMAGFTGAKRCGEIAKEAGLSLLGGGLTESTLGLTASAHLFNYLEIETPVDLNGPMFLKDDPVEQRPLIKESTVILREDFGIGCTVNDSKLQKYKVK
jgi:L-Ala-D/L-Glu epimerase